MNTTDNDYWCIVHLEVTRYMLQDLQQLLKRFELFTVDGIFTRVLNSLAYFLVIWYGKSFKHLYIFVNKFLWHNANVLMANCDCRKSIYVL